MFASQLANLLTSLGHECKVIALFDGKAQLPYKGTITILNPTGKRKLVDVAGWKKLAGIIQEWKPDVVQANAGDTLKYAVFSKLFFRWQAPIVFRNASTVSNYIKSGTAKLFNGFLYSKVDGVASVSAYTRNDLIALFPSVADKASVIPVGVDMQSLPARDRSGRKNPVILHVGGFSFEKNHIGIIDIFERIRKNIPEAVLWLVGDGPLRPSIEEKVAQRGLTDSVRFWGYQNKTLSIMHDADVLILPSILEGLPAVILEAFYCRIPVVAYSVGGISEVVRPGETGYLLAKNDAQGFAQAVQDVLRDPSVATELIDRAYQLVLDQYNNQDIAGRFAAFYSRLLKHKTHG